MKKCYLFSVLFLLHSTWVSGQTTYTFTGSGNWSDAGNWDGNGVPPNDLPAGDFIVIDGAGPCNVNVDDQDIAGTLTVANGATLNVNDDMDINSSGVLEIESGGTVNVSADLGSAPNIAVESGGEFTVQSGGVIALSNGIIRNSGAFSIAGTVNHSGGSLTHQNSATTTTITGAYNKTGGSILNMRVFSVDGGTFANSSGSVEFTQAVHINSGTLTNSGTITITNTNPRFVTLNGTSTMTNNGTGNITGNTHGIILNDNSTLTNNGAIALGILSNATNTRIEGSGTFALSALFTNNGTIAPGNSPGMMAFNGDFTNSGTLEMEIAGAMSFDQISVDGDAQIDGNIVITFLGGFAPPMSGPTYPLVAATGTNNGMPGVSATNASTFDVAYSGGSLTFNQPVVLPIELLSFEAEEMNSTILLSWRTATEQNNDYMAVERSADGVKFEELGRVKGEGTAEEPQEYSLADENPLRGLNYYRLRQVDFDGAFEYHRTISVEFRGKSSGLGVQAFPNPAKANLQARWAPDATHATILRLLDMMGRSLAEYHLPAGVSSYEVPLSGLQAGLYFLQASQGQEVEVMRFRKQ